MAQDRGVLCLADEPSLCSQVSSRGDDLDCDGSAKDRVSRSVYLTHSASRDESGNLVRAESSPGCEQRSAASRRLLCAQEAGGWRLEEIGCRPSIGQERFDFSLEAFVGAASS
jgi:hypothetical protein